MKAFFLDDLDSAHVLLCDDKYNPASFVTNVVYYKEVQFPDILTDIFNGKYARSYSNGIVISYTANEKQLVNLHVDSYAVSDTENQPNFVYVIGTNEDVKIVSSFFRRNVRAGYIIKPFDLSKYQMELVEESVGFPMLMKSRIKELTPAVLLLKVFPGPKGCYTIWDLFTNRVFGHIERIPLKEGEKNA